MTYMENIFICMASPLLIAALCMGKRHTRAFLFCLAGMGMCLLSAYLNTFLAALYGADAFAATVEIAPVVEEGMKLLPLLFYLLIFEPQARQIGIAAVITALSFATFENICYLLENGTDNLWHLVIRGFSTGAMHLTCAFVIGYGLKLFKQSSVLKSAGIFGLLCVTITFHALFNMLMKTGGVLHQIGFAVPLVSVFLLLLLKKHLKKYTYTE